MDRVLILAIGGCVLFGGLLVIELSTNDADQPAVIASTRVDADAAAAPPPQRSRIDELVQTLLLRPLFSATRRPADQTLATRALDRQMPNLRLTGIVIEPGRHLAIFAVPGSKPLVRLEGETLDDWRIDSIAPRSVSLSGPAGTQTLEPKIDPSINRSSPASPLVATAGLPAANVGQSVTTTGSSPPAMAGPAAPVRGPTMPPRAPRGPLPPNRSQ